MRHWLTCMGEVLVDFLPIEEQGTTVGFRMHPGGAPCNVAVGLARLGQPAAFLSKIATDFFGRYLQSYLELEGVSTRFLLHDTGALSTLAFVATESGEPVYTFYGDDTADTRLTADELPVACFRETRMLHFGSISLLRGTTPEAALMAVKRLSGHALTSFDPNLRPGLVHDERAYRDLIAQLVPLSDLVKVSAFDLAWLAPGQELEQAAADVLAQGAALVVVTRGSEGVLAMRATSQGTLQRWVVPAFSITVADTVGAGDAFSAGLLTALAEREIDSRTALIQLGAEDMTEILQFAAAVSSITCTRRGANPPTRAEVDVFLHTY